MISRDNAGQKITVDVERRQQEYDFFVSCGWITTPSYIAESKGERGETNQ